MSRVEGGLSLALYAAYMALFFLLASVLLDKPRFARYQNRAFTLGGSMNRNCDDDNFSLPFGRCILVRQFRFISGADPHGLKMTQFDILSQRPSRKRSFSFLILPLAGRVTRTAERLREGNRQISEYDRMAVTKTDGALVGAISFGLSRLMKRQVIAGAACRAS